MCIRDRAQVAAVASKSQERADAFAKANGVPSAYGDYRRMLERPDIDGVYIDTTNNFHYENMLLCLEYGKPFLCEKAFTITKEQAQEVFSREMCIRDRLLALNTLGVLYMVTKNEEVASIADLKGKTIYATGEGSTPQYALEYIPVSYTHLDVYKRQL